MLTNIKRKIIKKIQD